MKRFIVLVAERSGVRVLGRVASKQEAPLATPESHVYLVEVRALDCRVFWRSIIDPDSWAEIDDEIFLP